MQENDNLQTEIEEKRKIELYVNNRDNNDEIIISFSEIFEFMSKKRRIYALLMAICLLIGACVPLVGYQFSEKTPDAVALITYTYYGAEDGKAPDGKELNVAEIKSSYVVQNALESVSLSKKLSVGDVIGNIEINGILTDETMKQLEILEALSAKGSSNDLYYEAITSLELKYGNRYVVSLKNSFGKNEIKLDDNELQALLYAITDSYNRYFFDCYATQELPENMLNAVDFDSLDYIEQAECLRNQLAILASYCSMKAEAFGAYRSSKDGLSFADLADTIKATSLINVGSIYSEIFVNRVAKDYKKLITTYNYKIRAAELELQLERESLESVKKMIDDYKNEKLVILSQSAQELQNSSLTTEYYNSLIIRQMNIGNNIASITQKLAEYRDIVDSFATVSSADKTHVENDIAALYDDCTELYNLVSERSQELFATSYFKNEYVSSMVTLEEGSRISDNVKKIGIGAFAGLMVGFAAWFCDGLIAELKKNKKDGTAN